MVNESQQRKFISLFYQPNTLKHMFRSKISLFLLVMVTCTPVASTLYGAPRTAASTITITASAPVSSVQLTPQLLHQILCEAVQMWPTTGNTCTYGELRSGYNHGTVAIELAEQIEIGIGTVAYNVTYEGITVCVIIPV
jgi:hypothetical protein